MKRLVRSVALVVPLLALSGLARADVFQPGDSDSFPVTVKDTVRVTGKGIAGATVKVKVKGPAKAEEHNLVEIQKGRVVIGSTVKEFDVKPTGKGKVEVEVSVTGPQPGSKPEVTKYTFEVK